MFRKISLGAWAVAISKNLPKLNKNCQTRAWQNHIYGKQKPWSERDKISHAGWCPWRNHACQFAKDRLWCSGVTRGWILGWPFQLTCFVTLPCECVMYVVAVLCALSDIDDFVTRVCSATQLNSHRVLLLPPSTQMTRPSTSDRIYTEKTKHPVLGPYAFIPDQLRQRTL